MLKEVYAACKTKPEMTLADVMIECTGVGIKLATVEQAFRLGEFPAPEDAKVRPSEPNHAAADYDRRELRGDRRVVVRRVRGPSRAC